MNVNRLVFGYRTIIHLLLRLYVHELVVYLRYPKKLSILCQMFVLLKALVCVCVRLLSKQSKPNKTKDKKDNVACYNDQESRLLKY